MGARARARARASCSISDPLQPHGSWKRGLSGSQAAIRRIAVTIAPVRKCRAIVSIVLGRLVEIRLSVFVAPPARRLCSRIRLSGASDEATLTLHLVSRFVL